MALSSAEKQRRYRATEKGKQTTQEYRIRNKDKERQRQAKWRAQNLEKEQKRLRSHHLNHKYNLTLEDYDLMLEKQEHKCAICKAPKDELNPQFGLVIDHCHKENRVRGLLCWKCNTGLGKFDDDPEMLEAALEYLNAPGRGLYRD